MASDFGRTLTPTTTQWYEGREEWLQCPFCLEVDWCPVGKSVSKTRIFSKAQRQAGRHTIRNEKHDVDCCKDCSSDHKMPRGQQAAVASGHVNVQPAQASGHVDPLSNYPEAELVFFRCRPPVDHEFVSAVRAMHQLIPLCFWEKLHALLTSGDDKCKAAEAVLRRTWTQCADSKAGLLKTLSHCGAVRPWAPSKDYPLSTDKLAAYDSSRVAYKDFGNEIYRRGLLYVYGQELQCCTSAGSVGDLVEAALGFGYYMRWCVSNGYDKILGVKDGYDYALAAIESLETVMNFMAFHVYNPEYLAMLHEKHIQPIITAHAWIGSQRANVATVMGWRTHWERQTNAFSQVVIYEPPDDPMGDDDAWLP